MKKFKPKGGSCQFKTYYRAQVYQKEFAAWITSGKRFETEQEARDYADKINGRVRRISCDKGSELI
jgi:hypothetical protein